jgi:hypothetical protein
MPVFRHQIRRARTGWQQLPSCSNGPQPSHTSFASRALRLASVIHQAGVKAALYTRATPQSLGGREGGEIYRDRKLQYTGCWMSLEPPPQEVAHAQVEQRAVTYPAKKELLS